MEKLKQWWTTSKQAEHLRSLVWHALCVAMAAGLNHLSQNLAGLELPSWVATGLGLGLAQLMHALDNSKGLMGAKKV